MAGRDGLKMTPGHKDMERGWSGVLEVDILIMLLLL